jgi:hypothetical protein
VTCRGAEFFERAFVPAGGGVAVGVTGKLPYLGAVEMSEGQHEAWGNVGSPKFCVDVVVLMGLPSSLLGPRVAR